MTNDDFGPQIEFEVVIIKDGKRKQHKQPVAAEVPCTLVVNGQELATIMCTPSHLREFAVGYLFTSGVINEAEEITDYYCDMTKWRLDIETSGKTDLSLLGKRVYTSGCGKGVMYANVIMLSSRHPLDSEFCVHHAFLPQCMKWLLTCSPLYKNTRGVHTVALSVDGELPAFHIDDIGRHNAVDKVIGRELMNATDFSRSILLCTGRISSEILHKVKRSGIPIVLSRGVPTHQTILLAKEMGVTVVGFARAGSFTVYTHDQRISTD